MKLQPTRVMLRIGFLVGIFIACCFCAQGQNKQGNIWYFGEWAGVDFTNGTPIALSNGALFTLEGCATMCDTSGNLLFYTEGINVYNKNHVIMPNGTGLHGDQSSTQSALIVAKPGSNYLYYIFNVPAAANSDFEYSIVNMNLDSGLGDVINKNTVILSAPVSEKLAATSHSNGNDIWVTIHSVNNNSFYTYLLTSSGISSPVISNVGTIINSATYYGGYIKFSPQGNKLASAIMMTNQMDIFDFDPSTGVLSNSITFTISSPASFVYGVEFSKSGNALYLTSSYYGQNYDIYQFNINAGSPSAILASAMMVHSVSFPPWNTTFAGSLQLAPNDKIYYSLALSYWLSVINNPDSIGFACNPNDSAIYLGAGRSGYGLQNLISNIYNNPPIANLLSSDTTFCEKHCIDFYDLSTNNPTSWQWFFPGSDSSTSSLQNPTNICYNNYGSFDVTLIACNAAGCDTLVLPGFINVYQTLTPVITQSNDTLFSSPGVAYQWWSVDSGIITGATNNYFIPATGGSYYVIVTDSNGCNGASNTIIITTINSPLERGWGCVITPNPNQGSFTITLSTSVHKDFSVRIINAIGQTVFIKQETIVNGRSSMVNLENAVPGLYAVEVITREKVYRQKFVIATLPK